MSAPTGPSGRQVRPPGLGGGRGGSPGFTPPAGRGLRRRSRAEEERGGAAPGGRRRYAERPGRTKPAIVFPRLFLLLAGFLLDAPVDGSAFNPIRLAVSKCCYS